MKLNNHCGSYISCYIFEITLYVIWLNVILSQKWTDIIGKLHHLNIHTFFHIKTQIFIIDQLLYNASSISFVDIGENKDIPEANKGTVSKFISLKGACGVIVLSTSYLVDHCCCCLTVSIIND